MINKENKTDIIKASFFAFVHSLFFSVVYLDEKSIIFILMYSILAIEPLIPILFLRELNLKESAVTTLSLSMES